MSQHFSCNKIPVLLYLHEDPGVEKEMAIHSSILAWEIPLTKGARQALVHGVVKEETHLVTKQ